MKEICSDESVCCGAVSERGNPPRAYLRQSKGDCAGAQGWVFNTIEVRRRSCGWCWSFAKHEMGENWGDARQEQKTRPGRRRRRGRRRVGGRRVQRTRTSAVERARQPGTNHGALRRDMHGSKKVRIAQLMTAIDWCAAYRTRKKTSPTSRDKCQGQPYDIQYT